MSNYLPAWDGGRGKYQTVKGFLTWLLYMQIVENWSRHISTLQIILQKMTSWWTKLSQVTLKGTFDLVPSNTAKIPVQKWAEHYWLPYRVTEHDWRTSDIQATRLADMAS